MWSVTGVDIRSLVHRGKFVFAAQVGSPRITRLNRADNKSYMITVTAYSPVPEDLGLSEVLRRPSMNSETTRRLMVLASGFSSEVSQYIAAYTVYPEA